MKALSLPRRAAAQLAMNQVDVNEVEKLLAYYRRVRNDKKFRTLVGRLASQDIFVYSKQTKGYVRQVKAVVLPDLPNQPAEALWFLGWTTRFMRYYATNQKEARAVLGEGRSQPAVASKGQKPKGGR